MLYSKIGNTFVTPEFRISNTKWQIVQVMLTTISTDTNFKNLAGKLRMKNY